MRLLKHGLWLEVKTGRDINLHSVGSLLSVSMVTASLVVPDLLIRQLKLEKATFMTVASDWVALQMTKSKFLT